MKIKQILSILTILFTSLPVFAQSAHEFRVLYGKSDTKLLRNQRLDGSANYDAQNFKEFGIRYLKQITEGLYVESGVNYSDMKVKINPAPMGMPMEPSFEKLEIVSIPVFANYAFGRYFFVNGGPMVDLQVSENSIDSQAGIGYSLGLGGKYDLNKFSLFVNPNFKRHAVISFKKETY